MKSLRRQSKTHSDAQNELDAKGRPLDERNKENDAFVYGTDDYNEQDTIDEPLDPLEEQIVAYLDGELTPEEQAIFEKFIENEPELKQRINEERKAWNALELLDSESSEQDIVGSTVDRLNSETQAELQLLQLKTRRRRSILIIASICASIVLCFVGYAFSSLVFPDIQTRRERDCHVVERLPALEAAGSFEYLNALDDAGLFTSPFLTSTDAKPRALKSYEDLSQDRAFYRNQQRFESFSATERQRLRELYEQIDRSQNAARLWKLADDYAFWLAVAINKIEREQIETLSTNEKLHAIRKKQEFFKRLYEYSQTSENMRAVGNMRPQRGFGAPWHNPDDPQRMQNENNDAYLPAAAIRMSLPDKLKDVDLSKIYQHYLDFVKKRRTDRDKSTLPDDVFAFLKETDPRELLSLTPKETQEYLSEKTEEELESSVGLLVALSYLEHSVAERRPAPPNVPFGAPNARKEKMGFETTSGNNWIESNTKEGRNAPNNKPNDRFASTTFNEMKGPQTRFGFGGPFAGSPQNTIEDLADTLKNAPEEAKKFIFSNPPQTSWPVLIGLHWRLTQAREFNSAQGKGAQAPSTSFPNDQRFNNRQGYGAGFNDNKFPNGSTELNKQDAFRSERTRRGQHRNENSATGDSSRKSTR